MYLEDLLEEANFLQKVDQIIYALTHNKKVDEDVYKEERYRDILKETTQALRALIESYQQQNEEKYKNAQKELEEICEKSVLDYGETMKRFHEQLFFPDDPFQDDPSLNDQSLER